MLTLALLERILAIVELGMQIHLKHLNAMSPDRLAAETEASYKALDVWRGLIDKALAQLKADA